MVFSYNPNDPMCHSVYMESPVPTIGEIVNGQTPNPVQYATPVNPNGPKLAPQPTKDGYYKSDGVDDGRQRTLEEVGQLFGVTRERIRQIEAKALRKLRHPNRRKKLEEYVES